MGLQMNIPENNSCIVVINSMTQNYPLAPINCSLASNSITFLCEKSFIDDYGGSSYWNKIPLKLLRERTVICQPTWKSISTFCVNFLAYNKRLTVATDVDGISWDSMKYCKSIFYCNHKVM